MCVLFLCVTEFLAESNEGSCFLFEADTVGPGLLKGMDWKSCQQKF